MDITHLFKAGVMTVKLQRKGESEQPHKRILPKSAARNSNGQRDEFSKQAKDVCNKITTLRNVLIENRSAYMRIGQHLKSAVQMTDEQRDLIDRESEKFVTFYTQYLGQMREDWKKVKRKAQQREHMEVVLELLSAYLKSVQQIYLEQKKYRVQHELETYRLLKLASDKKKIPVRPAGEQRSRKTSTVSSTSSRDFQLESERMTEHSSDADAGDGWDLDEDDITAPKPKTLSKTTDESSSMGNTSFSADSKAQVALDEDIQKSEQTVEDDAKNLSPEDIQMFEEENVQLYQELQGLSEEVEAIGKNVVDIATLQDIFTEKARELIINLIKTTHVINSIIYFRLLYSSTTLSVSLTLSLVPPKM